MQIHINYRCLNHPIINTNKVKMSKRLSNADKQIHRDKNRPTYERKNVDNSEYESLNRVPSSYLLRPSAATKYQKSDIYRNPSETKLRNRQDHYRGNIAKRKNDNMVNNLKSELQTLKVEVSRLVNKESDRIDLSRISYSRESEDSNDMALNDYGKEVSDSVSVTSEMIIDEPLKRLERQFQSDNYDHKHYLELENNLLKTELRNLKNKYNISKQEWKQKNNALEKKNQYLEYSFRNSEANLRECKQELEIEVQGIKAELARRQKNTEVTVNQQTPNNQLLQEKLNNLYKELSTKNKTINEINLELNETITSLDRKKNELKKQNEINSQLNQQLQFTKNDAQRSKANLENQIRQKRELQQTIENLKTKIANQSSSYKERESESTEIYKARLENQLKSSEIQLKKLMSENSGLHIQLTKIKELNQTNEDEILSLKRSIDQCNVQIQNLSTTLRGQRQNSSNRQSQYKQLIDDTKQSYDKQILLLKKECDLLRSSIRDSQFEKDDVESKADVDLNEKQRQINRWKSEYKLLKHKYDELKGMDSNQKQEMQICFKDFKTFESTNKVLQSRNTILEEEVNNLTLKISELEKQIIDIKSTSNQKLTMLDNKVHGQQRIIEEHEQQIKELQHKYEVKSERLASQEKFAKSIQEDIIKMRDQGTDKFSETISRFEERLEDQDAKINKYVKEIKSKETLVSKIKKEIRELYENRESQIQEISNKQIQKALGKIMEGRQEAFISLKQELNKEVASERTVKEELLNEGILLKNRINELEREKLDLQQQIKGITLLYNQKAEQLNYHTEEKQKQIHNLETRLKDLEEFKKQSVRNLQNQINQKQEEIIDLRAQNRRIFLINNENNFGLSFDEALRNQIENVKKLQEEAARKNQEIYKLRDSYHHIKTELDNLKSETDIARLKFISEKKNIQINYDVELQQLKTQLTTEQKKVPGLQHKIKLLIEENKKKDAFIQNYIMGKKLPAKEKQMTAHFLKQYEIQVNSKNISEKLMADSFELERLNKHNSNLIKEIMELKEKLTFYEAISISIDNIDQEQLAKSIQFNTPQKPLNKMKSLAATVV